MRLLIHAKTSVWTSFPPRSRMNNKRHGFAAVFTRSRPQSQPCATSAPFAGTVGDGPLPTAISAPTMRGKYALAHKRWCLTGD